MIQLKTVNRFVSQENTLYSQNHVSWRVAQGTPVSCNLIFTRRTEIAFRILTVRLHVMQRNISKAFMSIRLSVKRVDCDKTKETCIHILIPHERSFIVF